MDIEEVKTPSRRTFLKGATAAVATAAAASLFGCSGGGQQADEAQVEDISWDEEADVLIVGGGLAGMSAAVTVATEGAGATCLLLEKGDSELGDGNSPFSGGVVMFGNQGEEANLLAYLKELRQHEETGTPDDVLEAFANELCKNLDWVRELGAEEGEYEIREAGTSCWPEHPELEHSVFNNAFHFAINENKERDHVTKFMYDVLKDMPEVTHKKKAQLTKLIQDPETKTVLGGIYSDGRSEISVRANKGVILTCGGFENNPQMMANYFSQPKAKPLAAKQNTGDCYSMCADLKAEFWHMNAGAGFWNAFCKLDDTAVGGFTPAKSFGITVGKNGRRYYMDWDGVVTLDWDAVNAGTDHSMAVGSRHGHMQFGGDWPHLPMPDISWFIFDQAAFDAGAYKKQGTDPVAEGFGFKADTIEELAQQADIIADSLVDTVDTWNMFCANGKDLAFYRPAKTLTPISTPPYYAVKCRSQILNTDGGPVRNAKAEIIDLEGNPIPHLYSAGEFGSVWSGIYQGAGNLGECMAFGRIAARSALGNE